MPACDASVHSTVIEMGQKRKLVSVLCVFGSLQSYASRSLHRHSNSFVVLLVSPSQQSHQSPPQIQTGLIEFLQIRETHLKTEISSVLLPTPNSKCNYQTEWQLQQIHTEITGLLYRDEVQHCEWLAKSFTSCLHGDSHKIAILGNLTNYSLQFLELNHLLPTLHSLVSGYSRMTSYLSEGWKPEIVSSWIVSTSSQEWSGSGHRKDVHEARVPAGSYHFGTVWLSAWHCGICPAREKIITGQYLFIGHITSFSRK